MSNKTMHVLAIIALFAALSWNKNLVSEKERQALQAIAAEFYQALENGDFETTQKLLADDWELFIQPDRLSKEKWLQFFDFGFKPAGNVKITVNHSAWRISPTVGWYKADEIWEMGLHRQLLKSHFLTTLIWEKRNGQWQMVHAHHTLLPEGGPK